MEHKMCGILCFGVFFGIFHLAAYYFLRALPSKLQPKEGANKLVAFTHATWITIATVCVLFVPRFGGSPWFLDFASWKAQLGSATTSEQEWVLLFSTGYFLYDWTYSARLLDWEVLIHHTAALCGLGSCLASNVSGYEVCFCALFTEVSTPWLHLRAFFKHAAAHQAKKIGENEASRKEGKKQGISMRRRMEFKFYSIIRDLVSSCFAICFIVARCMIGPILTFHVTTSDKVPSLVRACCLVIQILCFYWLTAILHVLVNALTRIKTTQKLKRP